MDFQYVDVFGDAEHLTDEIVHGTRIIQTFIPCLPILDSVSINFATYMRRNTGTLYVSIIQSTMTLKTVIFQLHQIRDNAYQKFVFNQELKIGETYKLVICSSETHNNAITARYGEPRHSENYHLQIGNRILKGRELACIFKYDVHSVKTHDKYKWDSTERKEKNNIVVYTANIGNYDDLVNPGNLSLNCDYVCFTSAKIKSEIYKPNFIPVMLGDTYRTSRHPKILPHKYFPDYEFSVYVDANIMIVGEIEKLIQKYMKNYSVVMVKHRTRSCIYHECHACIKTNKDIPEVMRRQVERYRQDGFPEQYGLVQCGVMIRKHNDPAVIPVMEAWWNEVMNGSRRDQLSFPYVAWKHKLKYAIMEQSEFKQYFVIAGDHK